MIARFAIVAAVVVAGCGEIKADFSADDDPSITSLTPDRGGADGGAMITVAGSGFSGDVKVVVGGVAAMAVTVASDAQLTFQLPPGLEGNVVDVVVATDHGFGLAADAFTYNTRPIVLDINPKFGRAAGGTNVTITGRGFQDRDAGVPTITIGGAPATNVQIVDDTTVTATTAAAVAGVIAFSPIEISIRNANGEVTRPKAFTLTAQGLLATSRNQVFWVDPATKATIQISSLPRPIGSCALSPDGQLYGRARNTTNGQHELVTFDPFAQTVTSVGPMLEGVANRAIGSMVFVGNGLFAIDGSFNQSKRLYSVSTTTGALTPLGVAQTLGRHSSIAARDGSSVYHVAATTGTLNSINTTTGALTAGGALTGGIPGRMGHAMTVIGATMYLAEDSVPGDIYTVNTTTGAMTTLLSLPTNINSLCKTPPSY